MTASTQLTPDTVCVAIDIAKRYHDVLIRWPDGREKVLKMPNTRAGHDDLIRFLQQQKAPVLAVLEPTADFHRPLAYRLAHAGIPVHLASSLAGARVREALYTSWDKHDRKDARVLMYLLTQGMTHPFHDPLREGYFDLQEISNTYQQIARARTRCQHSLVNHYLALYFPEMERYLSASRAHWFCHFLLAFPTPASITALTREAFVEAAWESVGRKVAKQQFLESIYEAAQTSMGLPVVPDSPAVHTFQLQVKQYLSLTEQRQALEAMATTCMRDNKDFARLQTLPGVGPIIALMILAESGDLRRFSHHRQYLKFCGFNLAASQSGNTCSRYRLAKRGNARLRYAYWLAATVAVRMRDNSFRTKFDRYIGKDPTDGDLKRKALTAVAVKMARVAHSLIKHEVDYRGYHEYCIPGGGTSLQSRRAARTS
ncbi:IS110 family transposase [Halomonas sp. HG01]|uniref:IS110 family transposase n=1 Tax=Halomonas sp. HG01 TaxID=1609967 RepID=UPI00061481AF|nr:IS110 family transposase [Halomonas sp. HG01]